MTTALLIGASGTIGSRLVDDLTANDGGLTVRLSSRQPATIDRWRGEGREAVILDLDAPETFAAALAGVDRVFLLTGYTADMLFQSKNLIDAAVDAGVSHLVHIGVFSSRRDPVPHYAWHDMIETYIEASGMTWTHLHPNAIIESTLVRDPSIVKTGSFTVNWGNATQGWVAADDVAAVAATVLREGPDTHGGKNYYLSSELLTGPEVATIVSDALGIEITCTVSDADGLARYAATIEDAGTRLYLESAVAKMRHAEGGNLPFELNIRDDIEQVTGRPPSTIAQWAEANLRP
jgi:NAD(P)H dehydrogenase (quinone)